jgi:ABC-type proline/glycine betaine transport system substrate-binding protein
MTNKITLAFAAMLLAGTATAQAADPEACKNVRFR